MAKIDLDSMSIDDLVTLRDNVSAKIVEKAAARQAELEAEMERLSQFTKTGKKAPATPSAGKAKKGEKKVKEQPSEPTEPPVAEAA
jgi:hypothetical protein